MSNKRQGKYEPTTHKLLDREDFFIIEGKLVLTDKYYKKKGLVNPNKKNVTKS